ncbi:uncharacterized protein L201_003338 [Kwoniella dendrophila CBS 6074]|uniref:Alcohol acetyltransferase n=1 Tax=Kwoniella dendrophila CBS 6074 TaxID=1295534 RepID=A0AAX4JSN6_9TREE
MALITENESDNRQFLSLHERYSVMRRNAGFGNIVIAVFKYPNQSASPTRSFLENRIKELQEHFPLLCSDIKGARTSKPYFSKRQDPWSASDILFSANYTPKSSKEEEIEHVYSTELWMLPDNPDFYRKQQWKVRMLTHPTQPENSPVYISLGLDHALVDGRGLIAICNALFAEDISSLPYEKLPSTTSMDATINCKPSLSYMLPIVFQKLILPKFPNFIQYYFKSPAPWPSTNLRANPTLCPSAESILFLPPDLIGSLKTVAKQHNIKTLHPIFKAAFIAGIWSVFGQDKAQLPVHASSPRSERNPSLGHSHCLRNYTSSYGVDFNLTGSEDVWTMAKKMADDLQDAKILEESRMTMGMLSYVPDGDIDPPHEDIHRPTKWEDYFLNEANSPTPYSNSLSLSNLGFTNLPNGAEDMVWGQEASPFTAPFNVGLVGHQAGVRMISYWREGSVVVKEEVKQLETAFATVLRKLVAGHKDTTLIGLTQDIN